MSCNPLSSLQSCFLPPNYCFCFALKDFLSNEAVYLVTSGNITEIKYHLFQKNCCPSPACALCDAPVEGAKHYFLYCPSFAALREKLFASAAQLLENRWHCASDKKKIEWFSNSISHADLKLMLCFSVCQIVYFLVRPFLLTSFSLCMFCSIVTC